MVERYWRSLRGHVTYCDTMEVCPLRISRNEVRALKMEPTVTSAVGLRSIMGDLLLNSAAKALIAMLGVPQRSGMTDKAY